MISSLSTQNTSILVLGAGELGMAVLRELAVMAAPRDVRVTVLLRPATLQSTTVDKQKELAELRTLGIERLPSTPRSVAR